MMNESRSIRTLRAIFRNALGEILYRRGRSLEARGKLTKAINLYERAATSPTGAGTRARRALAALGKPIHQGSRHAAPRWRLSNPPGIDFCVWVLTNDGMHVPPFVYHTRSVGDLQTRGLTPTMWQEWLEAVVRTHQTSLSKLDLTIHHVELGQEPDKGHWQYLESPLAAWPGTADLQAVLGEMWRRYCQLVRAKRFMKIPALRPSVLRSHPLVAKLLTLDIFLVSYPEVVYMVLPPDIIVLGTPSGHIDQPDQEDIVLRAATELQQRMAN